MRDDEYELPPSPPGTVVSSTLEGPAIRVAVPLLWLYSSDSITWVRYSDSAGRSLESQGHIQISASSAGGRGDLRGAVIEIPRAISEGRTKDIIKENIACSDCPPDRICIAANHGWPRGRLSDLLDYAISGSSVAEAAEEILHRNGYSATSVYHSPGLIDEADEFFSAEASLYKVASGAHPLRRIGELFRIEHLKYSSTLVFAGKPDGPVFPILSALSEQASADETKGGGAGPGRLLGFQRRHRGTFLVFAEPYNSGPELVGKFSLRPETDAPLENSHRLQERLREALPSAARSRIPEPLDLQDRFWLTGRAVALEAKKPGVIAWKVYKGQKRDRIDREADRFLQQLNEHTGATVQCDASVAEQLFKSTVEQVQKHREVKAKLGDKLFRLIGRVRDYHRGKRVRLVASHGDYGIGNLLVHEETAALTAVIDWSDGRRHEFPGVDRVNWMIQSTRHRRDHSFVEALCLLESKILDGSLAIDETYLVEGKSHTKRIFAALQVAALRYLERSLRYRGRFRAECGTPEEVGRGLRELSIGWESLP